MKAEIIKALWIKEYEDKFGLKHLHKIIFIDENLEKIEALYTSKSKEQKYFIEGKEAEFTLETIKGKDGKNDWIKIKPMRSNFQSTGGRAIKKEQSRYSGFAASYAKDLVVANKIKFKDMLPAAEKLFHFMVNLDKTLDS